MSCPDCFRGHEHEGEPKGKETIVHGRITYIAKPDEGLAPKGIIIIIPDAFGLPFVNNKLLADHYASQGQYLVYLPDFMDGAAAPVSMIDSLGGLLTGGSIAAWLWKPYYFVRVLAAGIPFMISNRFVVSWPKVQAFFEAVRCDEGKDLPIGAAGFCWGGKHTVNLAHGGLATNGKPLIDAGFTGHPSNLVIPGELKDVVKPISFAMAEKDMTMSLAQVEQVRVALKETGADHEVVLYEGAGHGFCVRADHNNEKVMEQSIVAEEQAIQWFKQVFSKTDYGGK